MSKRKFRFTRSDHIGTSGAEEDSDFLTECFVDTGYVSIAQKIDDHRQILVGRTGVGKTALITILSEREAGFVIKVSPENLALSYVSNSTILNYLSELGVNLDPFFKLLWRHVLTVELLRHHFERHPEPTRRSFVERLRSYFSGNSFHDREMRQAIDYLSQWGEKFWETTEYRVREITQKVEQQLAEEVGATFGIPLSSIGAKLADKSSMSEEQKIDVRTRAQNIVSRTQVQDLNKVMQLIDSVLEDRQQQYYLVVDGLDENWVEEKIRYRLIMALIVASKDFITTKNAKVIIALRRDLIDRVFRFCRDSGFQEEKFVSLYLAIKWSEQDLIEVLNKRINKLISQRGIDLKIGYEDLLPTQCNGVPIRRFILSRVERPRDMIVFFNCCISVGLNKHRLDVADLKKAERDYSRSRLRALADEWNGDYPLLLTFADILKGRKESIKISSISSSEIENMCLSVAVSNQNTICLLGRPACEVAEGKIDPLVFRISLAQAFYRVGLVGLKVAGYEAVSWANQDAPSISHAEITETTTLDIHPAYHRALGIIPSTGRPADLTDGEIRAGE